MNKPLKNNNTHTFLAQVCWLCVRQAACRALQLAKEKNIKKLVLYTDSKFTINGESEHHFHLHGGLRSILNQCDCCRCDPLGQDLEAEQLEAEVWRSRHQQRRL